MTIQQTIGPIAAELEDVLKASNVPPQYRKMGARLLGNLRRPLQILVTGLPGSGKSSLINMLLSRPIQGKLDGPPVLDVTYGAKERVVFELEDGKHHTKDGVLTGVEMPDQVVRVQQELPLPALNGLVHRELGLSNDTTANKKLLEPALQQADIVIWCTSTFAETERALWSAAPEEVKDHSFLVITKADQQMMQGVLAETIRQLESVAGEEFLGLYPVASLQAVTALTCGPQIDEHLWRSSGGKSLREEIRQQIQSGRGADIDRAQMILAHCATDVSGACPKSRMSISVSERVSAPLAGSASGTGASEILPGAVHTIRIKGKEMLEDLKGGNTLDTDAILARCVETAETLAARLQEVDCKEPALLGALEDAQKGAEMMVLFQLERGEDATLDAITLLLQLQKEFAAVAAA